jgi:hypothetical protein
LGYRKKRVEQRAESSYYSPFSLLYTLVLTHQEEEFKHFGMDLEWLLREKPVWRATLQRILFHHGDIVKLGERGDESGEKAADEQGDAGCFELNSPFPACRMGYRLYKFDPKRKR